MKTKEPLEDARHVQAAAAFFDQVKDVTHPAFSMALVIPSGLLIKSCSSSPPRPKKELQSVVPIRAPCEKPCYPISQLDNRVLTAK
jgi:hypothetical protein